MALVDSGRAIGAVVRLLQERLHDSLHNLTTPLPVDTVTVGELGALTSAGPGVNLFLYEVELDGHLKNVALDEGQPVPLWLVLHFLMTAFDQRHHSDTSEAFDILGQAMSLLQGLNFLALEGLLGADIVAPLNDNPDRLKITFDTASPDLLSKLMQRADDPFRCSAAFQVRPVMIAAAEPPSYSLLVGVDYTTGSTPGAAAVRVPVLPSFGPAISRIEPEEFETGASVTVVGTDLDGSGLAVQFGGIELPVVAQRPDRLTFTVSSSLADGQQISAGSFPLAVTQLLPTGRHRTSNLLVAGLLPSLSNAAVTGVVHIPLGGPASPVLGLITLTGVLLGANHDEVYVALFRDGHVVQMFDAFQPTTNQTQLLLDMPAAKAVPEGEYRVILRVNGRQARNSPPVVLTA